VTTQETPDARRRGDLIRFAGAFAGGVMTTFGLIHQVLPVGIVGVALALAFIVLLPRQPLILAGLGTGVALTLTALAAIWTAGWGCASEVDGQIIEHECGSPPAATGE
jgi:hypothetical protein